MSSSAEPSTDPASHSLVVHLTNTGKRENGDQGPVTSLHPPQTPNLYRSTNSLNEKDIPKKEINDRVRCLVLLDKFANYTTLHGFRNIAEESEHITRRIAWVFLTAFAFSLLLYQMGNSIQLYLSRPVAFNVRRNYYSHLHFPAITICNQNFFRITRAWHERLYGYLEQMFEEQRENWTEFHGLDEPLTEVLRKLRHRKEDLILSCTWNRVHKCTPMNFTDTLVDNSYCYTFNGNHSDIMSTSLTGSDTGLSVLMNIEQYEFMRTRSLTAGLQVYVHHQGDLPRGAIAIPPGMKAYIRVNTHHVELLKEPYGVCGRRRLTYFPIYSTSKCLLECKEKWLMKRCGCQSGLLPPTANETKEICSLRRYTNCAVPALAEYTPTTGKCVCPTHCSFRRYNYFISFAQISTFDVEQALRKLPSGTPRKILAAREVFYQVNEDKRYQTVNVTLAPFVNVTRLIHNNLVLLTSHVRYIQHTVTRLSEELHYRFKFHEFMLKRMVYSVRNNWIRGWQVVRERTLSMVVYDYLPLMISLEVFEEKFNDQSLTLDEIKILKTLLETKMNEKERMAERSISNLTWIHEGFYYCEPLIGYKITLDRYYDKDFNPESIIMKRQSSEFMIYKGFVSRTMQLRGSYHKMRNMIANSLNNTSINQTAFHSLRVSIERLTRSFNFQMFQYEDRIVNGLLKDMEFREKHFSDHNALVSTSISKLNYTLNNLMAILTNLGKQYNNSGKSILQLAVNYIKQSSSLKYNLTTLSSLIAHGSSGKLLELFVSGIDGIDVYKVTLEQEMWTLLRSLNTALEQVFHPSMRKPYKRLPQDIVTLCKLNATNSEPLEITHEMLRNVDNRPNVTVASINRMRKTAFWMAGKAKKFTNCEEYIRVTNSDWMLKGQDFVRKNLTSVVNVLSQIGGLITNVTAFREEMLVRVGDLKRFAIKFLKGNEISHKFVRDNFVELQIYFQDLVSINERQSPAYTMTELWSDFGGNFGLLLGASVLSVIEIIDFFVHETAKIQW